MNWRPLLLIAALFPALAAESNAPLYTISGTVVDSRTNAPLPRAQVAIFSVPSGPGASDTSATTTDTSGRFVFLNIPQGKYSLVGSRRGYLTQAFHENARYSTAIVTGPGLVSTDIVFPLRAPGVIYGRVLDQNNDPVPNAQILMIEQSIENGRRTVKTAATGSSDNLGNYKLAALSPGVYYLAVQASPWYQGQFMMRHNLGGIAPDDPDLAQLDIAYRVTFYPDTTSPEAAAPLRINSGDRIKVDFALSAVPAAHLRLNLPEMGGVQIRLTLKTPWQVELGGASTYFTNGQQFTSAAPGTYKLSTEWQDPSGKHAVSGTIDLSGSMTIDPGSLKPSATISAKVTADAQSSNPQLPRVALYHLLSGGQFGPQKVENGRLEWRGTAIDAGPYELISTDPAFYVASLHAEGATIQGRTINVPASGNVTLTAVLKSDAAVIDGKAVQDGKPLAGAMVLLLPNDLENSGTLIRRDQSDSDGSFTLPNVVPGRYTLLALSGADDIEYTNRAVMRPYLAYGSPSVIEPGQKYEATVNAIRVNNSPSPNTSTRTAPQPAAQ